MSHSPPIRRFSTASPGSLSKQEELINAYEAEEERIINVLSRKLEQVRNGIASFAGRQCYMT
jgi:coiled-coil domain-containing protein 6